MAYLKLSVMEVFVLSVREVLLIIGTEVDMYSVTSVQCIFCIVKGSFCCVRCGINKICFINEDILISVYEQNEI